MKKTTVFASFILLIMFLLMLGSAWNDSAIMDELAHIPAGFGYITQGDYRLNPEHPPLIKILSALSAQIFVRPHFPIDTSYWQTDVNGQWAQGAKFLYESGNDADKIIFWARLPMILLTILLGALLFLWVQKQFNSTAAIFTLIFFAFSPTFLTHGRYVTTDVGASLGFFIGIAAFIYFLQNPSKRNIFIAGVAFGIAQLLKFSLVLLVPLYGILILGWVISVPHIHTHERVWLFWKTVLKTIAIGLIGLIIIWGVYAFLVVNYPQERQISDASYILTSYRLRPLANFDLLLMKHNATRSLGEYVLGVLMVSQRAGGGNTDYFLNNVSSKGSRIYFPLLYILKEPLALHIFTLLALGFAIWKIKRGNRVYSILKFSYWQQKMRAWIYGHFVEFSSLAFIALYWASSITSPLNIGIRHVLPTFPFIYLLVSRQISEWLTLHDSSNPKTWFGWLKNIYEIYVQSIPKFALVGILFLWLIYDTVAIYPNFMPYYNELVGGPQNGYKITTDSNYDWGQDLKRLYDFSLKNNIDKIAIDYFGGGNPRYYFGDKFEPWWSSRGQVHGWFAISATFRQEAFGIPDFSRNPEDSYKWLKPYQPITQIGYSIFVYKLP